MYTHNHVTPALQGLPSSSSSPLGSHLASYPAGPLPHVTTPVGSIPTYALMVLLLPYTRRSYIPSTHLNRVDEWYDTNWKEQGSSQQSTLQECVLLLILRVLLFTLSCLLCMMCKCITSER